MKITDFLIIYFSIGAPFGVYFYFQNRLETNRKISFAKTLFAFLFWIPAAWQILLKYKSRQKKFYSNRRKKQSEKLNCDENLFSIQKRLEKILLESRLKISIYEFRETLERYVGLTLAADSNKETGNDFFRAAKNQNVEIAAKCFHRRNRQRLFFHQTLARRDFLKTIENLYFAGSNKKELRNLTVKLADILNDAEAQNELKTIFSARWQSEDYFVVKPLEKDLWKPPQLRKPLPANSISTFMQPIQTTRLRKKD